MEDKFNVKKNYQEILDDEKEGEKILDEYKGKKIPEEIMEKLFDILDGINGKIEIIETKIKNKLEVDSFNDEDTSNNYKSNIKDNNHNEDDYKDDEDNLENNQENDDYKEEDYQKNENSGEINNTRKTDLKVFKLPIAIIILTILTIILIGLYKVVNPTTEDINTEYNISPQQINVIDIEKEEEEIYKEKDEIVEDNLDNKTTNNNTENENSLSFDENLKNIKDDKEVNNNQNQQIDEINRAIAELDENYTYEGQDRSINKNAGVSFINKKREGTKDRKEELANRKLEDYLVKGNRGFDNGDSEDELITNMILDKVSIYEVKQGSVIPAILLTEVNTDLPGSVLAQIRENVYDTITGNTLLLPKGTRLYGRYESVVEKGQSRVFLLWDRIMLPNGKVVNLTAFQTADSIGNSGITDKVDNHTWELVGNALLSSILNFGDTLASSVSFGIKGINIGLNGKSNDGKNSENSPFKKVTSKIVEDQVKRKPTLSIRKGHKFNIIVNGDLILEKYKY